MTSKLGLIIAFVLVFLVASIIDKKAHAVEYLTAPVAFSLEEEAAWVDLGNKIIATNDQQIVIEWQGFGGYVEIMKNFVTDIQIAQMQGKHVTFYMVGDAYSAHAVAACYVDQIINNDQYFLMFHPISDGKNTGMAVTGDENPKTLLEPCVKKDILTGADIMKVMTAFEIYVYYKNGKYERTYQLDSRL